jgi:methyltransferase-like protein/SAM-dependent methyltransferase
MTDTATSYDAVPYPSFPIPQAHPDHLATVATLFGVRPPPVERCRVLELGCADGGNLIAMAERLPDSAFVGIDLSARQVAAGQSVVAALGLTNITLRQLSVLDLPDDFGPFDYILAHGLYSWVPPEVQAKLLAVCRHSMSPDGVAYVSYNVYPGWHGRGAVRDMMRFHTRRLAAAQAATAAARDLLAFLLEVVPPGASAYRGLLAEEQETLGQVRDTYIFHEHLEDVNEPVYFHEFRERAARAGLQFLAEADPTALFTPHLPVPLARALAQVGGDRFNREQYFDFLTNRRFRQTLLCHAGIPLASEPQTDGLVRLHVASCAECTAPPADLYSTRPQEFRGPKGISAETGHPISKAALLCLAEVWPRSLAFAELEAAARARIAGDAVVVQTADDYARDTRLLAENLLRCFAGGLVELHAHAAHLVTEPGERPRVSAYSRLQAKNGSWMTNARHEPVDLDALTCQLLRHLDGSRDRAALVEVLVRAVTEQDVPLERYGRPVKDPDLLRSILGRELDDNLRRLGRCALLVA